jgi:hypothetical protein
MNGGAVKGLMLICLYVSMHGKTQMPDLANRTSDQKPKKATLQKRFD